MANPFNEVKTGSDKPFWITGKMWGKLLAVLMRDRIIISPVPGIVETPTSEGRIISGLAGGGPNASGNLRVRMCVAGVAGDYDIVGTEVTTDDDEEEP